jgi:hypothetical protein
MVADIRFYVTLAVHTSFLELATRQRRGTYESAQRQPWMELPELHHLGVDRAATGLTVSRIDARKARPHHAPL